MKSKIILSSICFFLFISDVYSSIYYVNYEDIDKRDIIMEYVDIIDSNIRVDDKNNGIDKTQPFLSIKKTLYYVFEFDTIYIDAGIYYTTTLDVSSNTLTIIGAFSRNTIIELNKEDRGLYVDTIYGLNLSNITIKNYIDKFYKE